MKNTNMKNRSFKKYKRILINSNYLIVILIYVVLSLIIILSSYESKYFDCKKIIQVETGKTFESFEDYIEYKNLISKTSLP